MERRGFTDVIIGDDLRTEQGHLAVDVTAKWGPTQSVTPFAITFPGDEPLARRVRMTAELRVNE